MSNTLPGQFYGLVDMGSNGIRFSITDLSEPIARVLPVVFQDRLGISLYDAQFSSGTKGPIPQKVIDDVLVALKRFKTVCADFEVPETNITVLATEATRNAENSEDYRQQIKDATGWEVVLLPKDAEGKIGAMGIASSFETVEGLVMDLGGGSTQLTWMIFVGGKLSISPKGSISFPYGAAAMTQLLTTVDAGENSAKARTDLKTKIKQEYSDAFDALDLPQSLRDRAKSHGLTLYLSGGGFRGWGYLLMSKARKGPYPIPIINGYHASVKDFSDTASMTVLAADSSNVFRVSKRRASQVPAVAFLVDAIISAFPFITDVRFCQGGVREGFLFDTLSDSIRRRSPLAVAAHRYSSYPSSSAHLADHLQSAIPGLNNLDRHVPASLTSSLVHAIADTMYVQSNAPKETASLSALHLPITGVLATAHGISHTDRALLALALCQRWDGELPPLHEDFQARLQGLLSNQEVWWANYLGAVAGLIGDVYPAGRVGHSETRRVKMTSRWADGLGKKGNQQGIVLEITIAKRREDVMGRERLAAHVETIEGLGKKKNRIGGREYGFGLPVSVDVDWV